MRNSPDTKNFSPISSSYWLMLHYTHDTGNSGGLEDTLRLRGSEDQSVDSDGEARTGRGE